MRILANNCVLHAYEEGRGENQAEEECHLTIGFGHKDYGDRKQKHHSKSGLQFSRTARESH